MTHRVHQLKSPVAAGLTAVLCLLLGVQIFASQKPATPQAAQKTTGASVPLSFTEFHSLAATVDYLKKVASANPAITELIEIGRSTGDRPIHVLVVSNMKKGIPIDSLVPLQHPRTPAVNNVTPMRPYHAKPGQWIDGGLLGNTRAGTEACLFIADKLISGYGTDAEITKLVDDSVFYVCPAPNPDALAAASEGKPVKLDPAAASNGNFPEGWWKDDQTPGGTGDYPSSLAEARWILEFFTNHTNILLVQSFGSGGNTTLRPFARWSDSRVDARDLAVFDRLMGKKYLEMIGEPVPASWTAPLPERPAAAAQQPAQQAGRGGRGGRGTAPGEQSAGRPARPAEQARGWQSPYNNERDAPSGYGIFFDWAYGQFGSFAMSTQLPDAQPDTLEKVCDAAWQFERYKASLLPHVEITDGSAKVLYTTNQATRAVANQEGDAVAIRKSGTPGRYKVIEVTATIENTGMLPTQVANGPTLRGNREDVIWLIGANGKITFLEGSRWLRLGVMQGTFALPPAPRQGEAGRGRGVGGGGGGRGGRQGLPGQLALSQMREQRPEAPAARQTGNRRVVSWLVAVEGDAPLKLAVTSQKGGTQARDLVIQ